MADGSGSPPAAGEAPEKKRGRPKGSRNKVGADAKAMLAQRGLAGVKVLCDIAALKPVYRQLKGGGRERIDPTLQDALVAQRAILSRLVPELKSQEVTGSSTAPLEVSWRDNTSEAAERQRRVSAIALAIGKAGVSLSPATTYAAPLTETTDPDAAASAAPPARSSAPAPIPGGGTRDSPYATSRAPSTADRRFVRDDDDRDDLS